MMRRILSLWKSNLNHSSRGRCTASGPLNSKIPPAPTWKEIDSSQMPKVAIDEQTIQRLERLALVDFNNAAGIRMLTDAILLANQILLVDTAGVEPMDSVLEDRPLYLREDEVTEGNCAEDILRNAAQTCEGYFVAPPGNIPLPSKPVTCYEDGQYTDTQTSS